MVMEGRNNGHRGGGGITGDGYYPGTFTPGSMNSVTKHLILPGESANEMLMKGNFKNEKVRNAFLVSLQRFEEFKDDKHLKLALNYIAASDSINGERVKHLIEAVIGQWHNQPGKSNKKVQMSKYDRDGVQTPEE